MEAPKRLLQPTFDVLAVVTSVPKSSYVGIVRVVFDAMRRAQRDGAVEGQCLHDNMFTSDVRENHSGGSRPTAHQASGGRRFFGIVQKFYNCKDACNVCNARVSLRLSPHGGT